MVDHKPPRLAGGESETLRALLQYQRESLVRKVTGVDESAARRALVASGTTLLWLTKHMARAEMVWILHRFAGQGAALPDDTVKPTDALADAVAFYRATWTRIDEVVDCAADLEQPCRRLGGDTPVNLRRVLARLLEETARAGHADILRELIDGQTGR